jgi:hypothetical protein
MFTVLFSLLRFVDSIFQHPFLALLALFNPRKNNSQNIVNIEKSTKKKLIFNKIFRSFLEATRNFNK